MVQNEVRYSCQNAPTGALRNVTYPLLNRAYLTEFAISFAAIALLHCGLVRGLAVETSSG